MRRPLGLATAAVHAATLLSNEKVTQRRASDAADVSEATVRNRYEELLEASGDVAA